MRTTVNIDNELLAAVKSIAKSKDEAIGKVMSSLIRKGLQSNKKFRSKNNLPIFKISDDAQIITLEHIKMDEDLP